MANDIFSYIEIKTARQIFDQVFVYNQEGTLLEIHDVLELGKQWFCMSNDNFYSIYGFSWVPQGSLWERAKRAAGKL